MRYKKILILFNFLILLLLIFLYVDNTYKKIESIEPKNTLKKNYENHVVENLSINEEESQKKINAEKVNIQNLIGEMKKKYLISSFEQNIVDEKVKEIIDAENIKAEDTDLEMKLDLIPDSTTGDYNPFTKLGMSSSNEESFKNLKNLFPEMMKNYRYITQ